MAKKIFYFLLLTFHFSLLTSCSLDENPHDQIPEEEAYSNASALYLNTVATLYNYIGGFADGQGLQGTCRGIYDLQTFGSDEAMLPTRGGDWYDGGIWQDMYMHAWDPGHELLKNSWLYLYKVIALCNHSLQVLNDHKSLLTTEKYQKYTAEVRGLRAILYWYLLDLFGRVPIILSDEASTDQIQQASRSTLFKFIVTELLDISEILEPANSVKPGEYYGRVTQPVVYFVLAKLMLNAEVYLDDNWTDDNRPDGSQLRLQIYDHIMNAWEATILFCEYIRVAGYRLEDDYSSNFAVRNEQSNENIWIIPMDKDLYSNQQQNMFRSYHYRHAAAYGFSGENGTSATKRILEVFGYGTPEQDERFNLCYWAGPISDLDDQPVTDRSGKPLIYYPERVEMILDGSQYLETAGARMKKYEIDRNATKDGKLMDNDIVLFRFADVLLMEAEAMLRNGMDGQDLFNKVRGRVFVPKRPLTLQNLLDERLLELCWEGWRRQDLIRFGQYKSLYEGEESLPVIDESDGHTTVFPIPGDILKLNEQLTQNPGY